MTYEKNQNQQLSETVDYSNSEIRKNTKEIEVLKSQLHEVSQGKEALSDELERISKEYKKVSENQKEKMKQLQSKNEDLQTELKVNLLCFLNLFLIIIIAYDTHNGQIPLHRFR